MLSSGLRWGRCVVCFEAAVSVCMVIVISLEQFQEKCETIFRPELRQNKELEQFTVKRWTALTGR